ncbi:hypothetical protein ES703_32370 [subsurface metagenome]
MNEIDLDEFKDILGITKECIEIEWSGSDTGIEWNDKKKCWEIEYRDLGFDFLLIHELGHIYLYKKTTPFYFNTFFRYPKNIFKFIQVNFIHLFCEKTFSI